ncbi:SusD/RagB family nutrient-binding outer membrane lipoprotein [Mucilaginibacter ginsenosidivorax]|nr:SusD/RagB family nutrient-binding outer membrane lipoprotein [Mucilaginibacter ginsenosidivorax]
MTKNIKIVAAGLMLAATISSCQKGNLSANPNAISAESTVPVSLILNHLTANFIRPEEMPLGQDASYNKNAYKAAQFMVSNYDKYWGTNEYSWSYSGHAYDILKYAIQLENQSVKQVGANNKYLAVAKFFRAYAAIWLSQRVGDIPMSQAGDPIKYPTPVFDTQHDVYKNALQLLDDANTAFNAILTSATQNASFAPGGDIFNLTNLQWQKLINTYRLRVLISLSKRADDNADLNIKTQFATILGNPTKYPIMTANSDNMVYKFNSVNLYPIFASGSNNYNNFLFVGKPVLDITTSTADPRTFLIATPVDKTKFSSFSSYQGAPTGTSLATLFSSTFSNYNGFRYDLVKTGDNAEPFIFIGYPEMCFNIAEAINRGWVGTLSTTDAQTWYNKGVTASFANFGLTLNAAANQNVNTSDVGGVILGSVTTDYATFLNNIAYNTTNSAAALTQILTQKYVAMFSNSGWEAFYNYRRTGVPAFPTGPSNTGYGTVAGQVGIIPRRLLYPLDEINANNANYKTSIGSQFGGTDDVTKDTWLTK